MHKVRFLEKVRKKRARARSISTERAELFLARPRKKRGSKRGGIFHQDHLSLGLMQPQGNHKTHPRRGPQTDQTIFRPNRYKRKNRTPLFRLQGGSLGITLQSVQVSCRGGDVNPRPGEVRAAKLAPPTQHRLRFSGADLSVCSGRSWGCGFLWGIVAVRPSALSSLATQSVPWIRGSGGESTVCSKRGGTVRGVLPGRCTFPQHQGFLAYEDGFVLAAGFVGGGK